MIFKKKKKQSNLTIWTTFRYICYVCVCVCLSFLYMLCNGTCGIARWWHSTYLVCITCNQMYLEKKKASSMTNVYVYVYVYVYTGLHHNGCTFRAWIMDLHGQEAKAACTRPFPKRGRIDLWMTILVFGKVPPWGNCIWCFVSSPSAKFGNDGETKWYQIHNSWQVVIFGYKWQTP